MSNSIVTTTSSKDELAILAASDDRELRSQGLDDFLPYDVAFTISCLILEVKPRKNHDNRGVFVTLKVTASDNPDNVRVGKTYAIAFFDQHKTIPEFVIAKMMESRREFAAALDQVDCTDDYKAAPTLLKLAKEVEPLDIPFTIRNKYQRTTRTGKAIHELQFALGVK